MEFYFVTTVIALLVQILSKTSSATSGRTSTQRPNIIFIVADDAGWNDFSFHGSPQIPTPNIDALALSGVILNNYYASPLCTPTRGAIMTGKHPIHIKLQHFVVTGTMVDGLPLEEKILPQYLKELGYATHLVGKWHLGHARKEYSPTFRGFDSHYGNWLGSQDYYDHFYQEFIHNGYDLRRNMDVDLQGFGEYTTDLYTNEAIRVIQDHPSDVPLFLQLTHIAPHAANSYQPLQAPIKNVEKFDNSIEYTSRRIYAGMVDKLDESIGQVIEALQVAGMLENSIVVFTSDNGGAPEGFHKGHGSNWPLRGGKNSLWEGGTRVAGFIWSTFLPQKVSMDIMHVQDWLPTLVDAAGGSSSNITGIDGVSQWDILNDQGLPPRTEFLYNIDDIYQSSGYRFESWKVVQGNVSYLDLGATHHWDDWYGPHGRDNETSVQDLISDIIDSKSGQALSLINVTFDRNLLIRQQERAEVKCEQPEPSTPCDAVASPCLFNLTADPCEIYNIADDHPDVVMFLLQKIHEMNQTAKLPFPKQSDLRGSPRLWDNTWTNFLDYLDPKPNPTLKPTNSPNFPPYYPETTTSSGQGLLNNIFSVFFRIISFFVIFYQKNLY